MGCKPSKESQVATGNTVNTTPNLQKKKSNASNDLKIEEITSTVTPLPTNKTKDVTTNEVKVKNMKDNDDIEVKKEEEIKEEKVEEIKNVRIEDVQLINNNEEEKEEGRNVIAPDSPDQFFSTRKDEVPVAILTVPLVDKLEADDVPEDEVFVEDVEVEDQKMKEEEEEEDKAEREMGCNPSKESQVATGNTVNTTPNLQKKKSNASINLKTEEITNTVTPLPANKTEDLTTNDIKVNNVKTNDGIEEKKEEEIKEEKKLEIEKIGKIKNVRVKDVEEGNNNEEEKGRSVIAPDSPEQFFSTRNDEVRLEILTVPLVEKLDADDVPENDGFVDEVKVVDLEMKEEKKGEPSSSKDSADLKEIILVKEEES